MSKTKTKTSTSSVEVFIDNVRNEQQRIDSLIILEMMKKASGKEPKMWGASVVGFGNRKYKSPHTGKETEWYIFGFSPRKANLSLHLGLDVQRHASLLQKLGKFKTGVGCLYINRLSDVDVAILQQIISDTAN